MNINAPAAAQIPALRRLWQQTFGDTDAFLQRFFSVAFSPERCRCVCIEDTPVAALYWFDCRVDDRKVAYLYAIATAAAHRRKGLCRALLADTHRHLETLGYAGAVLVPAEQSLFNYYEKQGYRPFGGMQTLTCDADCQPAELRALSVAEYAALRQQYLPAGGVVHTAAALELLADSARFYAGEDFVLCAYQEADTILAPELLGNTSCIGSITAALGCKKGTFRTCGTTPFAMYFPFTAAPIPTYFGLALD